MRLAACLILGALSLVAQQDEWPNLPLVRVDSPPDSLVAAGLALAPTPGGLEITVGFDNSCEAKVSANYQAHGAVVKIRLTGPPPGHQCPAGSRPEAYRAMVTKLKPKRYQVIIYTKDKRDQWRPWKVAVAEVSP
jgi:hypothetical protein